MKLKQLFNYFALLRKFQRVERQTEINDIDRKENDAEHSFQVAMVSWYLAEAFNLKLDTGKLVKYALAHDLVETYAGDTGTFHESESKRASKEERERASLEKIAGEQKDFTELVAFMSNYEKQLLEKDKDKLFFN